MKKLFLLFLFVFSISQAQTFTFAVYEQSVLGDRQNYLLFADENEAYFIGYKNAQHKEWNKILEDFSVKEAQLIFLKSDYQNQKLYNHNMIKHQGQFQYLTGEEEIPDLDWEIHKEYQTLLGQNTQKATTTFRGRTWTVWFAKDIPLSEGPWKLKGLPGLIMEAESKDFNFSVVYVNLQEPKENFPTSLIEFFNKRTQETISMKEFFKGENEFHKNIESQITSDLPEGSSRTPRTYFREFMLEVEVEN